MPPVISQGLVVVEDFTYVHDCLVLVYALCCHGVSQVPPTADELGYCDVVELEEVGDTNVVIFRRGKSCGSVAYNGVFFLSHLSPIYLPVETVYVCIVKCDSVVAPTLRYRGIFVSKLASIYGVNKAIGLRVPLGERGEGGLLA